MRGAPISGMAYSPDGNMLGITRREGGSLNIIIYNVQDEDVIVECQKEFGTFTGYLTFSTNKTNFGYVNQGSFVIAGTTSPLQERGVGVVVNLYIEYAELQALERRPMAMQDPSPARFTIPKGLCLGCTWTLIIAQPFEPSAAKPCCSSMPNRPVHRK